MKTRYVGGPSRFYRVGLFLFGMFFISGCLSEGQSVSYSEGNTQVITEPTETPPVVTTPPERTICDPFGTNSSAHQDRGLVAHMVYLDETMPPLNGEPSLKQAAQYYEIGNVISSTFYFDRLFVPTRRFDLGFYTQAGDLILNHKNEPLYEYFALRFETQMQLSSTEASGWYQVALLSDDGSVLTQVLESGERKVIVNNDGDHPTKLKCSEEAIYLEQGKKYPMIIDYYQGPRYHISMNVLWRPMPDPDDATRPLVDPLCGQQGNSLYFDYSTVPSTPQAPFYELLSRGWKVLENENYHFPSQTQNPCVPDEEPLLISGFVMTSATRTSVTFRWTTNLPSSSQIWFKNVGTGEQGFSPEDSELKTEHQMTVSGLLANTIYSFKALSASAGGQVAESDERAIRTPR